MLRNCPQAQYSSKQVSISYRLKTKSSPEWWQPTHPFPYSPLINYATVSIHVNPRQLNTTTDDNFFSEVCVYVVSKILNKLT